MIRLAVTAHIDAPTVIVRERQSSTSPGLDFIPGSALRGALAESYLRRGQPDDESFRELFLNEDRTRFSPLYPGMNVFPATALSCKREPGFQAEDRHGVRDLLILRIARFLKPNLDTTGAYQCPRCGNDMKALEGFFTAARSVRLEMSVSTHVGIDRITSTAAPGVLYSREEINPGQCLYGSVTTSEHLANEVARLCALPLRVGSARSRGKGALSLRLIPQSQVAAEQLVNDWREWNREMHRLLPLVAGAHPDPHDVFFTLTLHSDTICVDRYLRAATDPSSLIDWLPPAVPGAGRAFGSGHLGFVTGVIKLSTLRGWNVAHGLPRTDDQAVTRGSVFAYRLRSSDIANVATLYDRLLAVYRNGLGLRRNEGYGMITICDRFHTDYAAGEGEHNE